MADEDESFDPLRPENVNRLVAAFSDDPRTRPGLPEAPLEKVEATVRPEQPSLDERISAEELLDRKTDREERLSLIRLRRISAVVILIALGVQLVFMNTVLLLCTWKHPFFHISSTVLRFYLVGTLGEIFGVVTVTARFLFSTQPFLGRHPK